MSRLFGKKKTPAEMLRENKRMLDKAIRELDRERQGLQNQEKKLIDEIKRTAKQGQNRLLGGADHLVIYFYTQKQIEEAVKVMAKSLVRNRHAVTKLFGLKSQLQAVSLRVQTLKSTQAMADAMRGATKAMGAMNKRMSIPALTKIMREFEKQNEKMEMTSEMMGDAIDDAFEGDEEEEETDDLVNQVLAEIGLAATEGLVSAPATSTPQQVSVAPVINEPVAEGQGLDVDLQARLDNLRKGGG